MAIQLCVAFALLVCSLTLTGALSKTALCLAILCGLSWVWTLVDLVGLNWFMHRITLHELITPGACELREVADALDRIASERN
ncbi:hypothetical protein [Lysobacter sp. A3-1-A15]|uniref:hypothetical protein n=1 Tax=Novilysobacter viscosus TaxID=3098602 RepID=UPI002ED87C71